MTTKNLLSLLGIGVFIGLLAFVIIQTPKDSNQFGARFTTSITDTSSTVNMVDTLVNTPAEYQFFYGINTGAGHIFCTWTTTSTLTGAVLNEGLKFDAATLSTSTEKSHSITDPNLLNKYMHCIADTTSSMGILKY